MCVCVCVHVRVCEPLSSVQLLATQWTVAQQVPPSMGFSSQEYGVGCQFLLQGIFPTQQYSIVIVLILIYARHCFLKVAELQRKLDHEIRMREGACKLLAACSQREQALEATKSLLVCNSRILNYMGELQRRKEAQVLKKTGRR